MVASYTPSITTAVSNLSTHLQYPSAKAVYDLVNGLYTVATLPTGVAGMRSMVSDATVSTFYSIVAGGGAITVPVFSDGANWRIG